MVRRTALRVGREPDGAAGAGRQAPPETVVPDHQMAVAAIATGAHRHVVGIAMGCREPVHGLKTGLGEQEISHQGAVNRLRDHGSGAARARPRRR